MWARDASRRAASVLRAPRRSNHARRCVHTGQAAMQQGAGAGAGAEPTVRVQQGVLRGRRATAKFGGAYFSFQGVPYARPPLGDLRFEPPQPPESWQGVKDALQEGSVCPHRDWIQGLGFRGDEDCLFLNVYTSQLPTREESTKKPVMVWIHGGGYYIGSGNTDMYGPDYLVESGVVVVTMNYRLGALGFLSLEDESYPGNMGLRDQVAALLWVKDNIAQFGGDPDNVTLFGESAGASCVQLHMMSPMSKGLFHKAIAQSGSVFNPWGMTSSSLRTRAFKLGELLGCKTSDASELVNFLKKVSPKDLVEGSAKTISKEERRRGDVLSFNPIPENALPEKPCFLPGNPEELLQKGKYHDVPYLAGVTSDEGILELSGIIKQPRLVEIIANDFERLVPKDLCEPLEKSQEIAEQIKDFYFDEKSVSMETLQELSDVYTDMNFVRGIDKYMKLLAEKSTSPLYYYKFSFDGELGIFKKFINASSMKGASHMDDLGYLFRVGQLDIDIKPESLERNIIRKVVKMWTNFAKTGNPTSKLDEDVNIQWIPYTSDNRVYLNIDKELKMEKDLFKERLNFWENIYKSYKSKNDVNIKQKM
ncbi:hypothetical protein R5R35_000302 [Gryllus longicercus]